VTRAVDYDVFALYLSLMGVAACVLALVAFVTGHTHLPSVAAGAAVAYGFSRWALSQAPEPDSSADGGGSA
jgi:hypothetical protein